MKQLPDEKIRLEVLEEFKELEQVARNLREISTAFAYKLPSILSKYFHPEVFR